MSDISFPTATTVDSVPPPPERPMRAVAYSRLFLPLDAAPTDGDLDDTAPASAAQSPELSIHDVAGVTGYDAALIRRASGAGPYHSDDLRRLYWRSRRLWHEEFKNLSDVKGGLV